MTQPLLARVITALAVTTIGDLDFLYASCSDGTLWAMDVEDRRWRELPAIPQPETRDDG